MFIAFSESLNNCTYRKHCPIASDNIYGCAEPAVIVGVRENIFSENPGFLQDVAAGKEQVFGTLTQRMVAKVEGRLLYGQPDFPNLILTARRDAIKAWISTPG
ncbi:MAG: 1,3-beta-glucan synthase component-domain-containing protein [Benniella sp.]|nr:MAG: 1,3-beta-glucan synthase component-domain-containing protein [Benniella sp.]